MAIQILEREKILSWITPKLFKPPQENTKKDIWFVFSFLKLVNKTSLMFCCFYVNNCSFRSEPDGSALTSTPGASAYHWTEKLVASLCCSQSNVIYRRHDSFTSQIDNESKWIKCAFCDLYDYISALFRCVICMLCMFVFAAFILIPHYAFYFQ